MRGAEAGSARRTYETRTAKARITRLPNTETVLSDVMEPGLKVAFCGTAAGHRSAQVGAYYAGRGNRFWATLYEIRLTPRELAPREYRQLLDYGVGLTDLCKQRYGSDAEVGRAGFDVEGLTARLEACAPSWVAFNGKNAARGALRRPVDYGEQPERLGPARIFVLPSTSGAARKHWNLQPWRELTRVVG